VTSVHDRVIVVTGGASGIGWGISRALRERGATVVIADIDRESVAASARELGADGILCDVADPASVALLAQRVDEEHGGADIIVANAGVGSGAPLAEMTRSDWNWMLGVNLFGVIDTVSAFLPQVRRRAGHVVVTASMAALAPTAGLGAYAVSKAGVLAFAEVLAAELGPEGLGVTVALPGPTRTRIARSQRARIDSGALEDVDLEGMGFDWIRWRDPIDVGRDIVEGIEGDAAYVATHPELWERFEARVTRLRDGFGA